MIRQGARLGKVWAQKAHVLQKIVLYFKGVIVNTMDHSQWSRPLHLKDKRPKWFPAPQKEEKRESKELD